MEENMGYGAWKVRLQNGAYTIIRKAGENVSFKDCLEILTYRGYEYTDIQSLEEIWEVNYN